MKRPQSVGKCGLCGSTFSKGAITRHLGSCGRPKGPAKPPARRGKRLAKCFHLVVEGRYLACYWIHLAVPPQAHLAELDRFLKRIWLECCGHLSAFTIDGLSYDAQPFMEHEDGGMEFPLEDVLDVGTKFHYEYDFGSTTELNLRVAALREYETPRGAIQLLARNDHPQAPCDCCDSGRPATQICTECQWSEKGWLCDECAAEHECDEGMFLPVVNSPRAGVCRYTG